MLTPRRIEGGPWKVPGKPAAFPHTGYTQVLHPPNKGQEVTGVAPVSLGGMFFFWEGTMLPSGHNPRDTTLSTIHGKL